jgi:hypothetical protein
MTTNTPVSQESREAAADLWRDYVARLGECMTENAIRQRKLDECLMVQAIAAAEQRGRLAERERCARIASDAARTILSIDKMNLPVSPGPIISRDRAAQCEHIAQAILSAKDQPHG